MRIEKLSKWLKEKDVDIAFVTSKENVYYLTGFYCEPHERLLAVLIFQNEEPILIVPKMEVTDARNSGWKFTIIGIDDTENPWTVIDQTLQQRNLPIQTIAIEKEHLTIEKAENLNIIFSNPQYISIEAKIHQLRMIKSTNELKVLREAARLADYAIEIGANEISEGKTEMEILSAIEYRLKKQGIAKMSFATMVLAGENAASPHGVSGNTQICKGDFVLFDLGIVVDNYCSDITRTIAFDHVNDDQKQIYQTVLKAQLAAIDNIAPRRTCAEIDLTARNIITEAGFGNYFPHRLGHGLGISVHEYPSLTSVNSLELQEGMVFTVEPGIYVPGKAGVRIEDDVYVTATGVEVLTKYPKELVIV